MQTFIGLTTEGGYAEYCATHHTAFVKVDDAKAWSAVDASCVVSTYGTVWEGALIRGQLQPGETVRK